MDISALLSLNICQKLMILPTRTNKLKHISNKENILEEIISAKDCEC